MIVYSAKVAKKFAPFRNFKVMSTNQKNQMYQSFKKCAIKRYKATGRNFDGSKSLFSRNVYGVTFQDYYLSSSCSALPFSKELPLWTYFNSLDTSNAICKKTATLLRSAGYKVEVVEGKLLMWKGKR